MMRRPFPDWLRLFAGVCVAIILGSASSGQDVNESLNKLVATELAFAETAARDGTRAAFLKFLADDGVVFQPEAVSAHQFWSAAEVSPALLAWQPEWADISADGQIGYTTGPWEYRPEGAGQPATAFGEYITIWQRQTSGKYKAVLDIGIRHATAKLGELNWESPQPSDSKSDAIPEFVPNMATESLRTDAAKEVRVYRNDQLPIVGRERAIEWTDQDDEADEPHKSQLQGQGGSGDLRYHYGIIERASSDGVNERANQLRIWKCRDGKWQIVLEVEATIDP